MNSHFQLILNTHDEACHSCYSGTCQKRALLQVGVQQLSDPKNLSRLPSQQEKDTCAFYVLGPEIPELRSQYTYTCMKSSEHPRFELDTRTLRFSQEFTLYQIRIMQIREKCS